MKFVTLAPKEFTAFASSHPQKSFLQTEQIAKLRQSSGWTPYYFGVKQGTKILAASLIVGKTTFLGKKIFYAPGGPLIDYENTKLLNFFIQNLKIHLKSEKAYVLRIDPYYELIERDIDGKIVTGGFNHQKAAQNLKKLGFKPLKACEQPKYLFALDLNNRTPDELLKSFRGSVRNHLKNALKKGVTVRELKYDELSIFKKLTTSTSKRRNFHDRDLKYYQNMYQLFGNQVKFILAEATIDGKVTPLSATMFLTYGDEVISLFSGSHKPLMKYNAQYVIKWEMIQYAANNHFKRYNFFGIQGLPDPKKPDYGIYATKRSYGGRVIELLGTHELPLSPVFYLRSLLSGLKKLRR